MVDRAFVVGDVVGVFKSRDAKGPFGYAPIVVLTVTRVLKSCIETSDGRKWRLDGHERGDRGSWNWYWIAHMTHGYTKADAMASRWRRVSSDMDTIGRHLSELTAEDLDVLALAVGGVAARFKP